MFSYLHCFPLNSKRLCISFLFFLMVFQAWGNGMYKSIENRAVKNANKARMSIAAFVCPDDDAADIGPVESMILDLPKMYSNVKKVDYFRHRLAKKLEGKDDRLSQVRKPVMKCGISYLTSEQSHVYCSISVYRLVIRF